MDSEVGGSRAQAVRAAFCSRWPVWVATCMQVGWRSAWEASKGLHQPLASLGVSWERSPRMPKLLGGYRGPDPCLLQGIRGWRPMQSGR